jgi:hypothetical protein
LSADESEDILPINDILLKKVQPVEIQDETTESTPKNNSGAKIKESKKGSFSYILQKDKPTRDRV